MLPGLRRRRLIVAWGAFALGCGSKAESCRDWRDVYEAEKHGGAKIVADDANHTLTIETAEVSGASAVVDGGARNTRAILMLSNAARPASSFEATIRFTNEKCTRTVSPNPWECSLWFVFNAGPNLGKPFNYLAFKWSAGLEGGYAYNEVDQHVWKLYAPDVWPLGAESTVTVRRRGRRIEVERDGHTVVDYQVRADEQMRDEPGLFGVYVEDGRVRVSRFDVKPLD